MRLSLLCVIAACIPACATSQGARSMSTAQSLAADRGMIAIPDGTFVYGSSSAEREAAYDRYLETAGHDAARRGQWFRREYPRQEATLGEFLIDKTPVTNAAYAEFVAATGRSAPTIDEATWRKQGFAQAYATEVRRFNWINGAPPPGREHHPVVLVTWHDASDYCHWRGSLAGTTRQLPSEFEFEKAARGVEGVNYPWGPAFDADKLNSAVSGPRDTTPVSSHTAGKSPFGVLDAAGNVFQWTRTPWSSDGEQMTVKGSARDDYGGLGRGAARHGRNRHIRHAIVGFRCAAPSSR